MARYMPGLNRLETWPLWHHHDAMRSRDVIGHVTIRLSPGHFSVGSQQEATCYIPKFPRYLASEMQTDNIHAYIHVHTHIQISAD